jgi:hypothetical protein
MLAKALQRLGGRAANRPGLRPAMPRAFARENRACLLAAGTTHATAPALGCQRLAAMGALPAGLGQGRELLPLPPLSTCSGAEFLIGLAEEALGTDLAGLR